MSKQVIFVNAAPNFYVVDDMPNPPTLASTNTHQKVYDSTEVANVISKLNLINPAFDAKSGNPGSPPPTWPKK